MKFSGPKIKLSRALGIPLTVKARKYLERRPFPPGQHGPNHRAGKMSEFKRQLLEKQRLRAQYNISETQLRNYFQKATRIRDRKTGEALVQLLERRLDAVVYRGGLAKTIYAARQYVGHGHVLVNGRKVDIASYRVKPGDVVSIKEKSRGLAQIQDAMGYAFPRPYVELNREGFAVTFRYVPTRDEIPVICDEQSVVEFYSR